MILLPIIPIDVCPGRSKFRKLSSQIGWNWLKLEHMRILMVEDEKGVANFIKKGLSEEHYAVDLAVDGEEGRALAFANSYDLIILDIMLPGINGIDLCKAIRQKKIQAPVLMLTAKDSVRDRVTGLDSGADDYLTKPFSFEELNARVRAMLRRRQNPLEELRHKDLRVDVLSHRVFAGKNEIILRAKEYAILVCLVRNRGRVLSRTQIIENVWGYDFDPVTNIVDVHVKALREKIGKFVSYNVIKSVRGSGYMIEATPELHNSD
jgi:DNA-binding response OmpR family regulator